MSVCVLMSLCSIGSAYLYEIIIYEHVLKSATDVIMFNYEPLCATSYTIQPHLWATMS